MTTTGFMRLAIPVLMALAACASTPPPPFAGPGVDLDVTHFPGTPLSGPVPDVAATGALDAVTVTVLALERLPDDLLEPASLLTDLIVAPPDAETLLPTGRLARGARYGPRAEDREEFRARRENGDLGRTVEIGSARAALGAGITARLAITTREPRTHPDRPEPVRPRLTILLRGETPPVAAGPLRIALVLDGLLREEAAARASVALVDTADEQDVKPAPPPRRVVREETLLLRSEPGADGHRVVILVPTPFDPSGGEAIAILMDVTPPPDPDSPDGQQHLQASARCRQDVADAAASARTERTRGVPTSAVWPGLGETLGTGDAPPPRRALAFLARGTGAAFAEDVALSGADAIVAGLGTAVFQALRDAEEWPGRDALAWILDREAYRTVTKEVVEAAAAPALEALLVRHLGEVGRHPALVEEIVLESESVLAMARHVKEENLIFLEDNAPASRLRAFDWLTLGGHAPDGYHPLASRKERRDALREALEKTAGDER